MQPQPQNFNPKTYLIHTEQLEQLQCIICTQKTLSMMQCKNCKKKLCNQCAVDQKIKNNKCPLRCSNSVLEIEVVPELVQQFRCPFSGDCGRVLGSVKEFHEHGRECQFISAGQRGEQEAKWQFACRKGHRLEIRIDSFDRLVVREKCSSCHQVGIMRALCRRCNQYYCNYCRPLPIHDMKCPAGHQFCKRDLGTISYRCDLCEIPPVLLGVDLYDDFICNYGLCGICYQNWPSFPKPVNYCINYQNCCDIAGEVQVVSKLSRQELEALKIQHTLRILPNLVLKKCSLCEKDRPCYKKCLKCDKYYCFLCKRFQIMQNLQCEYGHKLHREQVQKIEEQDQEQNQQEKKQNKIIKSQPIPKKCYSCITSPKQKHPEQWIDDTCGVVICRTCIIESISYNFDVYYKFASINLKPCVESPTHPLFYLPSGKQFPQLCHSCKKQKLIRFNCSMCQNSKLYCTQCIPAPDVQHCYCGRSMRQQSVQEGSCCALCGEMAQVRVCRPCNYGVCEGCLGVGNGQEEMKMEVMGEKEQEQQEF